MSKTVLILGASRGIGLGLAREFLERGWKVVASERDRSDDLHALEGENLRIVTADVTEPESYADLGLSDSSVDAIIVNAGITGAKHQDAARATSDEVAHVMMTNAFGPARAGRELLPTIKDGGSLAFMSSLMGSIEDSSGGYDLYRTSKTAQNMLAKGIAEQHAKERDIAVLSLHPGWVQTDMGGDNAKLTVHESVSGLADVVENSGGAGYRYVDYKGEDLPF
ncbi:SDR family oxidoreductase [Qipengyuania pelagi]|jgi:NAD(P)-dependent dehydrogenase (short-subunit alcohol dehydrogenase family)|uniref:SDR family NAD(P)-dependent oxidoreductase n=1 Tax=Qipengyuania pelagi TaxID=994320 RepID=A0A844YAU1_9SPHN|nr:SDR family NAD(P)-dependent oxidoreductase [Qipengyuania pelagi]MXO54539.1 SDR family NAD(P)-dependent oxidoreductase [Qipengyuania pelagi]